MIGNGKRPLSLKDRVDDYTLGLEDKKEKRKEKEEQESHWRNINKSQRYRDTFDSFFKVF